MRVTLPAGCWACGGEPDPARVRAVAVLVPRAAADGGPVTVARCPLCAADAVVEPLPGGALLLAAPETAGLGASALAARLDGARAVDLRRRGLAWAERHGPGLALLRASRAPGEGSVAPPPREARRGTPHSDRAREEPPPTRRGPRPASAPPPRPAPPPPPPAPAAPPPAAARLPATAGEARAVLGVAEGADRETVDAAFRAAARRCHPDLVAHLDAEFQALAHEKFLRVRRAHEILAAEGRA